MTRVLYLLPLVALLFGCSPNFHCRKCQKLGTIKTDTVYRDTTIYTPVVKFDTVIQYDLSTDTLVITKDRLTIKYKRLPGDTIFLAGECKSDTVRVDVPVLVTNEIKTGHGWWALIVSGLVGAGAVAVLMLLRR